MRFIFPRVLALTVIVGLGALVLSLVFKLLIGATLLIGLVFAARSMFHKSGMGMRHQMHGAYHPQIGDTYAQNITPTNSFSTRNKYWRQSETITVL